MVDRREAGAPTVRLGALDGKVALVTGGGRGLGREICSMLAEAGATVVVADAHRELAEATARELGDSGATVLALALDVRGEAAVKIALDEVHEHLGRVDLLVGSRGGSDLSLEDITAEQWTRVIDVGLVAPFITAGGVFPAMREGAGDGAVVTSTAVRRSRSRASAKVAGTWGLLGFSHAGAADERPGDVGVTVLASGAREQWLPVRVPAAGRDGPERDGPLDASVAADTVFLVGRRRDAVIPGLLVLPMGWAPRSRPAVPSPGPRL